MRPLDRTGYSLPICPWPKGQGLALALAACAGINALVHVGRPPAPPDPLGLHIDPATAVETASLLSLGMRRLAGDLGLIRMIIYYGSAEDRDKYGEDYRPHEHKSGDHHEHSRDDRSGEYPKLAEKAKRVLDIDPSLTYAALYAAGALAFNLNRPEEALDVLEHALKRDPKNLKYQSYIGAIGFHRTGKPEGVIRLLKPILDSEDCPTMIKSMMAYLYRKSGRRDEAIKLYREILEDSRDEAYHHIAKQSLKELKAE